MSDGTNDTLSPALRRVLADDGPGGVLSLARAGRGPIVEATGDPDAFDVTFVFSDRRKAPATAGLFCPAIPGGFARLGDLGDGVFASTFPLPRGARMKYHFCPDLPADLDAEALFRLSHSPHARRLDYLNPNTDQVHLRGLRVRIVESLLTLPGAVTPLPVRRQPGVPEGCTEELTIDSRALGRRKQCLIYRPAQELAGSEPLPVVLLFQGNEEWQETSYFDNLIAAAQVPPFVAVLFRERSFTVRLREFSGGPAHIRFVTDELWPVLGQRGLLAGPPATVAGFSAGGLAAASLAAAQPVLFPRLGVVSGALHLTPTTDLNKVSDGSAPLLLRQLESAQAIPDRVYVAAGQFEDAWEGALLTDATRLARVCQERGATVRFDTGPTGHDGVSARSYLGSGLGWLMASR